jgi:hypothetical protein
MQQHDWQQHDWHCLMTVSGLNWRIIGAQPGVLMLATRLNGHWLVGELDINKVDFESYAKAAVEMDYAQPL